MRSAAPRARPTPRRRAGVSRLRCRASTHLLLRCRRLVRRGDLLIIGGERRDILIIELGGDHEHDFGAALAVAALPHLELEGDVPGILSGEIGDRGWLTCASRSVAVVASLNVLRGTAHFGELLATLDERGSRARQRQG